MHKVTQTPFLCKIITYTILRLITASEETMICEPCFTGASSRAGTTGGRPAPPLRGRGYRAKPAPTRHSYPQ
jgi:hypothetical protein